MVTLPKPTYEPYPQLEVVAPYDSFLLFERLGQALATMRFRPSDCQPITKTFAFLCMHWKTVLDRRFRSAGKISSSESGLYGWLVRIDLLGNDGQGQYTLLSRRGWFDQDGTSSAQHTPRPG
jgi:hypothetical protein